MSKQALLPTSAFSKVQFSAATSWCPRASTEALRRDQNLNSMLVVKKTLCPPPCFLHTAPPLLWALAPLLCLNCFLKFTGLFLRRKRHVVIRTGWAVPRREKKASVTPLAARKKWHGLTNVGRVEWEAYGSGWSARRGVKWVWRRCLAEGGESGVSVIGEREVVRPHCILGSPSTWD